MITPENAFFLYRLLLAHYIADFPLQTSKVYFLKISGLKGGIVHSIIVAVTAAVFLAPVFPKIWPYLVLHGVIHLLEDEIRVIIGRRFNIDNLWLFLLDQALHVFVAWGIVAMAKPWQYFTPPVYTEKPITSSLLELWNYYYYSDAAIIKVMLFIAATYGASILFMYIETYWMPRERCYQIGEPRQMLAIVERGILFLLLLKAQMVIVCSWIIARLFVWLLYRKRVKIYERRQILAVIVFNWLVVIFSYFIMMWMLGG